MSDMFTCEEFGAQLLDSLYGLLDESEAASLRAHLQSCPACQASLAHAERHKRLLSQAARVIPQFPAFSLPGSDLTPAAADTTPADHESPASSPTLPFSSPGRDHSPRSALRRYWPGWAVAAAALVAAYFGYGAYERGHAERADQFTLARSAFDGVEAQFALLQRKLEKSEGEAIASATRDVAPHLWAYGPAQYNPEISNTYPVVTQDADGNPRKTVVHTEVIDSATGKTLHKQDVACKGEGAVTVPAGLPINESAVLVIQAESGAAQSEIRETLRRAQQTYASHLAINKSSYQVGEVVFFRTLTLDRFSLKPPEQSLPLRFNLINADGKTVKQLAGQTGPGGISGGVFAVTNDLASGGYVIQVTADPSSSTPLIPQTRALEIVRVETPQIALDRSQYKPGDTISSGLRGARQAGGGPLANQPVTGTITADGKPVPQAGGAPQLQTRTDAKGNADLKFDLPPRIEKGKVEVEYQYRQENNKQVKVVQPVPVLPSGVAIDLFPEGGDLVAGLPCKVYYRVKTPLGDPVDPEGHVIIMASKTVLHDSPRQQGLGSFTFTPDPNETYSVRITGSGGVTEIADPFGQLKIKTEGAILHAPESFVNGAGPIPIVVGNQGHARRLFLLTTCRGQIVDQQFVALAQGPSAKTIPVGGSAQGVLRVTAYDTTGGQLAPLAERLVYRAPAQRLEIAANAGNQSKSLQPGQHVNLGISCKDEKDQPTPAWLLAAVVDDKQRAEKHERGLNAHFYLAGDFGSLDELENSHLVLGDAPAASAALDLFLGTQGWRRFVREDAVPLLARAEDATTGKAAAGLKASPVALPAFFSRESAPHETLRATAQANLERSISDLVEEAKRSRGPLEGQRSEALQVLSEARTALAEYEKRPLEYLRIGLAAVAVALLCLGAWFIIVGTACVLRKWEGPTASFAGAFACLFACLALYLIGSRLPGFDRQAATRADQAKVDVRPPWPPFAANKNSLALREPGKGDDKKVGAPAPGTFFAQLPLETQARGGDKMRGENKDDKANVDQIAGLAKNTALRNVTNNSAGFGGLGSLAPGAAAENASPLQQDEEIRNRYVQAAQLQENRTQPAQTGPQLKQTPNAPQKIAAGQADTASGKKTLSESKGAWSFDSFREYAYNSRGNKSRDTQDTLVWHPVLFADNGQAQVSFDLSQNMTAYRVLIYANSPSGRLGFYEGRLEVGSPNAK